MLQGFVERCVDLLFARFRGLMSLPDDEDDLALRRQLCIAECEIGERASDAFLVQLADFTRDRRIAISKDVGQGRKSIAEPWTALVKHQSRPDIGDFADGIGSCLRLRGQKAEEEETVGEHCVIDGLEEATHDQMLEARREELEQEGENL